MKKIIIAVVACIVLLTVGLLSVRTYSSPDRDNGDPTSSVFFVVSDAPGAEEPADYDPTVDSGVSRAEVIDSGRFSMGGSLTRNGKTQDIVMYVDDVNMAVDLDYDGIEVCVLTRGDRHYIVNAKRAAYVELSESLLAMLRIDPKTMAADPSELGTGGVVASIEDTVIDGEPATVKTVEVGDRKVKRYFMSGVLTAIEDLAEDGSVESRFEIDFVYPSVPADKIDVPASYTQESIYKFMKKLIRGENDQ